MTRKTFTHHLARIFLCFFFGLLALAGIVAPHVAHASGTVEATYTSPSGGRMLIYSEACVLFGEQIPNAKKLEVIAPDGRKLTGCIGEMQGYVVGLFESETPGEVRVVNLSGVVFRKATAA